MPPPIPHYMHEYQKKRLTKWAIRKWLNLKDMFLVAQRERSSRKHLQKTKAGARGSRNPNGVFSKQYCTEGITKVKEKVSRPVL